MGYYHLSWGTIYIPYYTSVIHVYSVATQAITVYNYWYMYMYMYISVIIIIIILQVHVHVH